MSDKHKKSHKTEEKKKDVEEEMVVEQGKNAEELEKKAEEYLDGWKRCQADFENYKKIQGESQKDMMRYAIQGIVLQILPVLDNFQAAVGHIPVDQKDGPWVQGIMYIQKQLEGVLLENGVEEIGAEPGENFDPKFHEAVEDAGCKTCKRDKRYENKIIKVISKGYKMGDRVIRPVRVVVE